MGDSFGGVLVVVAVGGDGQHHSVLGLVVIGFTTEGADTVLLADNKVVAGAPLAPRIRNTGGVGGYSFFEQDDVGGGDGLQVAGDIAD